MKVRCIDDCDIDIGQITNGKVYDVLKEGGLGYLIIDDLNIRKYLRKDRFEIVKEENKMEKTFREVIADIKEGEVWESKRLELVIKIDDGDIYIGDINNNGVDDYIGQFFGKEDTFKLKRKEYTFTEAFKAYEEGKEIESCNKNNTRFKKINGKDCFYSNERKDFLEIDAFIEFKEVRDKWYINN